MKFIRFLCYATESSESTQLVLNIKSVLRDIVSDMKQRRDEGSLVSPTRVHTEGW